MLEGWGPTAIRERMRALGRSSALMLGAGLAVMLGVGCSTAVADGSVVGVLGRAVVVMSPCVAVGLWVASGTTWHATANTAVSTAATGRRTCLVDVSKRIPALTALRRQRR